MSRGSKVVFYGPRDIRVEPAGAPPTPGAMEVLVRVEACAICGSDVKTYLNGNPRITPPRTMGHEFCGVVEEVGPGVQAPVVGQRVAMATTMGCGTCPACRGGKPNICDDLEAMGFHHDGAMAPWVLIPGRGVRNGNVIDVGDLPPTIAALAEPVSCVVNSLSRLEGTAPSSLLVVGLGPLGLVHALMARDLGVEVVVGVARPGPRFDTGLTFGLDSVVTPQDVPDAVAKHTAGRGFDAVVVTAPSAEAQSQAPAWAAKSGMVSLFAGLPRGAEMLNLDSRAVHYREQTVYGTSDSTATHVRRAVDWLGRNTTDVERLITHRMPVSRFTDALDLIMNRKALKVVLLPEDNS